MANYPTDNLCMIQYHRKERLATAGITGNFVSLPCQDLQGHDGEHTWAAIYNADTVRIERAKTVTADAAAAEASIGEPAKAADDLCGNIRAGVFDPYLEMILAAAHNRKRTLRSVPGFTNGGR